MRPRHPNDQSLTKAEKAVLLLLWEGFSTAETAQQLGCSKRTVDFHIGNIFAKWKIDCRVRMIRIALAKGIIAPPAKGSYPTLIGGIE
jgi:DNA-binding CsgD family transcriptional regulator